MTGCGRFWLAKVGEQPFLSPPHIWGFLQISPLQLLTRKVRVKFDNGRWCTGEVKQYDKEKGQHSVYFSYEPVY